ncbi:MAG: aminotransferase class III-fold pyridoxal phosphate-dependent enzyme, partial [Zavarzinia sp.]|nr:aminotransferase class III-fold pyridoxal phosphate-dependent enzyme [Zavarzinia sp.]
GTMALAATVATTRVFDAFWDDRASAALMHGPTYMGNALACAVANASLDLFESEPRLDQVRAIEGWLRARLPECRDLPGVVDVRVKGAIGVVQLDRIGDLNALKRAFVEAGVWVRPFGDIVYLTPAFTVTEDEVDILAGAIRKVLAAR